MSLKPLAICHKDVDKSKGHMFNIYLLNKGSTKGQHMPFSSFYVYDLVDNEPPINGMWQHLLDLLHKFYR